MKASEIKSILKLSIKEPEDLPPMFIWGGPGIGKSSCVKQAAEEMGVDFIDIRMLLLDPTDLRGIPVPEDGHAKWLPPSFLPREGRGLFCFDELNRAPELVQNSTLQLVLDRKLGEYELPKGWAMVCCGNRETEGFVRKMDPALLNRFMHINFDTEIDEWAKWAVANYIDPRIIGLLKSFRPELLYKFHAVEKAFPTPRSWHFASDVLDLGLGADITFEMLVGLVGEGAATELNAYMRIWSELPDLDAILNKGDDTVPKGVDLIYACCVGLVSKAETQKHFARCLDYALALDREYTVFFVKMLFSKDRAKTKAAPSWQKLSKILVTDEKVLAI